MGPSTHLWRWVWNTRNIVLCFSTKVLTQLKWNFPKNSVETYRKWVYREKRHELKVVIFSIQKFRVWNNTRHLWHLNIQLFNYKLSGWRLERFNSHTTIVFLTILFWLGNHMINSFEYDQSKQYSLEIASRYFWKVLLF